MMIEEKLQSIKSIPAAYQTLSSFEKSLLHLASIIYEPVSRAVFVNCLRRAGITGPAGEWLTAATLSPYIQRLQNAGLLDKDWCCPESLVELVSRAAVAAGDFREMSATVQAEISFSQYQSKWPLRCLRAMREYRIGLYNSDIVHLENMHPVLDKQCRDEIVRFFPAVRFCNNPFDPDWLRTHAPSLQFYLLSQMMNYSLHYLSLLEESFLYQDSSSNDR